MCGQHSPPYSRPAALTCGILNRRSCPEVWDAWLSLAVRRGTVAAQLPKPTLAAPYQLALIRTSASSGRYVDGMRTDAPPHQLCTSDAASPNEDRCAVASFNQADRSTRGYPLLSKPLFEVQALQAEGSAQPLRQPTRSSVLQGLDQLVRGWKEVGRSRLTEEEIGWLASSLDSAGHLEVSRAKASPKLPKRSRKFAGRDVSNSTRDFLTASQTSHDTASLWATECF